jgi:hypothetical protein
LYCLGVPRKKVEREKKGCRSLAARKKGEEGEASVRESELLSSY